MIEIFLVFLRLGLTCFGGPIAHIAYFREEFVVRRGWIEEKEFADLVALCQFLPGPASSQVGFSIGLRRGGLAGALAAWCGFTLPSALFLILFALGIGRIGGTAGLLHGLRLVAVAIVAQAVWGMARTLCPDRRRAGIALAALLIMLFVSSSLAQFAVIILGAAGGLALCRGEPAAIAAVAAFPLSRRAGMTALVLFAALLIGVPLAQRATGSNGLALFDAFYRSGALVFGGGHVVLPLLREAFVAPGWVGDDSFLAGYGAAQAVPGPLFTFAAYLGAVIAGVPGAIVGLAGIFLPGMLLLLAALPYWQQLRHRLWAQALMRGVNAAVVGLLGAALYAPLWTNSVRRPGDFAIAAAGFLLLTVWRAPPLVVVALGAAGGFYLA
jgi:chromate transporter